jgi:FkbM family methyltransferase
MKYGMTSLLTKALSALIVGYGYYSPYHIGKWRLIQRLATLKAISKIRNSVYTVRRGGVRYQLDISDPMDRGLYYIGVHEGLVTKFLQCFLRSGLTCFDVGANIGYYSLLFSKLVGPFGQVHGFEPCPNEFGRLQRNVFLNDMSNINLHQIALGDIKGKIGITKWKKGGLTRVSSSNDDFFHEARSTTLDDFCKIKKIYKINVIKVDIEGYEVKFLHGALETILRNKPTIVIELNPTALDIFGNNVLEIKEILCNMGYTLYKTHRKGLKRLYKLPTKGYYINAIAMPAVLTQKGSITWTELKSLVMLINI